MTDRTTRCLSIVDRNNARDLLGKIDHVTTSAGTNIEDGVTRLEVWQHQA